MSVTGAVVLGVFGTLWAVAAVLTGHLPPPLAAVPVLIGLLLAAAALRLGRRLPPRSAEEENRVGRLVTVWSIAEGVAIFAGVQLAGSLGAIGLAAPIVAAIVGLHFLPLARGIPYPPYYASAALLLIVAAIGLVLPATTCTPIVSAGSAVVLWGTVAHMLRRWLSLPPLR